MKTNFFNGKGILDFAPGGVSCAPPPLETDVLYMETARGGSTIYDTSIALVDCWGQHVPLLHLVGLGNSRTLGWFGGQGNLNSK